MPIESLQGRGATRNAVPTRFNLPERLVEGDWLDEVEARLELQRPVSERLARLETQVTLAQASLNRIERRLDRR